jgi:release factor glutamine methyltransferase
MTSGARSPLRRLWRKFLHYRFRHRRRADEDKTTPVVERVLGLSLVVPPGVFNPRLLRTGAFLAESLSPELVPPGSTVLDLGTGSGIAALVAARWAGTVVAVDLNPDAVRAARANAILNEVEAIVQVREGDLFDPVGEERFDVVVFNPPYYRGKPIDRRDLAWRSPDVDVRFAEELGRHLAPGGRALVCLSTDSDIELQLVDRLAHAGFSVDVASERDLVNEVLRLYRVAPRPR